MYVVKCPVLGLQRAPENSEFAPSVYFSLQYCCKFPYFSLCTYLINLEFRNKLLLSLEEILVHIENFEILFHFTGDFPGAIQLLFEAKDAAKTYSHFRAIQQLSHNLQDTLELAEEQLDVALSKVCIDFKESTYARLQVFLHSFKVDIF